MLSPVVALAGPQRARSFVFNVSPLDEQLFDAVQKHNAVEVEHLIQKKSASVNAQDKTGKTPLFVACMLGDRELAQLLLNLGADINAVDVNGWTALHWSVRESQIDTSSLLLNKGADLNRKAQFDMTPLHAAIMGGATNQILELLIKRGAEINPPFVPVEISSPNASLNSFSGSSSSIPIEPAKSPLQLAVWHGNLAATKLLLEHGAYVDNVSVETIQKNLSTLILASPRQSARNLANNNNNTEIDIQSAALTGITTPLHDACFRGHTEIVKLLLSHNPHVTVFDTKGVTPLYYAISNGFTEIVKLLLEYARRHPAWYSPSEERYKDRTTPLHIAAKYDNVEVCELLISEGCSVFETDRNGSTPIHVAAYYGNLAATKCLALKGASLTAKDARGKTPLDVSADPYKSHISKSTKRIYTKEEVDKINAGRQVVAQYLREIANDDNFKASQGISLLESQRPKESIEKFTNLIDKNPKSSFAYVLRAAAHKANQQPEKAVKDYTKAIQLDETDPTFFNNRAVAYLQMNDEKKAYDDLTKCLTLDPRNTVALNNMGHLLFETGNFDDAYDHFVTAVKMENPDFGKGADTLEISYDFQTKITPERKFYRILSIDGGGIRGMIPAMVLKEIEHRTHKPTSALFDLVSGTSTGGMIALGLSAPDTENGRPDRPKYTAEQVLERYIDLNNVKKMFGGFAISDVKQLFCSRYSRKGPDSVAVEMLGNLRLSEAIPDNVLVTSYELTNHTAWNFTKRDALQFPTTRNFLMRDAARASSAAPSYYDPAIVDDKYVFVDGGIFANNPTLCAYLEAKQKVRKKDMFIVSLGTGEYAPGMDEVKSGGNYWMVNLYNFVSLSTSSNTDNYMKQLFPEHGKQYFRFQSRLKRKAPLDATTKEEIKKIQQLAEELLENYYNDEHNSLNKVIETLLIDKEL